jgi:ketosteroid isomerase-like protein
VVTRLAAFLGVSALVIVAPGPGRAAIASSLMPDRQALVRQAFAALDDGDIAPFRALFDPNATWIGIPQRGATDETPACPNRAAIVDRLEHHHANGRRFELGKVIEGGDRVALEITVHAPEWSGPVTFYKVFTFSPGTDVVVRLNDCIDESYALQVLAA